MHRERICIYSRIKDSRDAAAAAAFFFLSGPSNRDIMHRQPSNGCSSDWRSAVQLFPVRSGSNTVLGDAAWTRGTLRCLRSTFISLALFALLRVQGGGVGFKKGACPRKHPTTFLPIVSSSVNHSTLEKTNKKRRREKQKNTFKVKENNSSRWQHGGISFKATTPTLCTHTSTRI